jgi:hypothetical protein
VPTGGDVVWGSFQRNTIDRGLISIRIERWVQPGGRDRHKARVDSGLPHGPYSEWPNDGWSGHPFGELSRRFVEPSEGAAQIYVYVDPYILSVQIIHQAVVESGVTTWLGSDKAGDRLALEGFGRDALANTVGSNLLPAPNATVNGHPIANTKRDASGKVFVPIQSWCSAMRIIMTSNRERGTLSFARNGIMYVLPVAADRAKRGFEWRDLGGFIVRFEGNHYAPLAGLDSLL